MQGDSTDIGSTDILLAEDEAAIREGLAALLESEGYAVRAVADGVAALEAFRARRPGLLLLDVMMPRKNGYAVCAEVRASDPRVPVLFLTAKDGDADELRGLSLGADDYIPKTASEPVLLARIARAVQRTRALEMANGDDARSEGEEGFVFGDWRVDTVRYRLVGGDGRSADLSLRELELLRHFHRHPGEVATRDFLLTRFWGLDFEGGEAALSTAIARLREKLGSSAARIETVRGVGYRAAPERPPSGVFIRCRPRGNMLPYP